MAGIIPVPDLALKSLVSFQKQKSRGVPGFFAF